MKMQIPKHVRLSEDQYVQIAVTGREFLRQRQKDYKGPMFGQDLAELSGVALEKVQRVLAAEKGEVALVLTGVEWERLLSAAHVFPEDLLAAANVSTVMNPDSKSRYGVGAYDSPPPSEESDHRIRAILDAMSDFFLLASTNAT
jgi:hypothetical protein